LFSFSLPSEEAASLAFDSASSAASFAAFSCAAFSSAALSSTGSSTVCPERAFASSLASSLTSCVNLVEYCLA